MLNTETLKVGDRVGVSGYGWNPTCEIRTVTRRTATQILLDDGSRWTKRGRKVGQENGYSSQFLMTEAEAIAAQAREILRTVKVQLQVTNAAKRPVPRGIVDFAEA